MAFSNTKLNPAAPVFPPEKAMPASPPGLETPTPTLDTLSTAEPASMSAHSLDTATLPDWALVQEDEKLRVAALTLTKTSTRDEWRTRLQQFANILAPGLSIGSTGDSEPHTPWTPLAVRQMPAPLQLDLTIHGATFTFSFLHNELRGIEWSPGFYFILPQDRRDDFKFTAYWVLDADLDPYLPKTPGEHGAKLTPFFNSTLSEPGMAPSEEDYMNTPVFIGKNFTCEYRYFGNYSQTRFSDKLDYERMVDGTVPPFVLEVWAKNLTQRDLQPWVKNALREHIWPKPEYDGLLPLPSPPTSPTGDDEQVASQHKGHDGRVQRSLRRFAEELQQWEVDTTLKLSLLTEKNVHDLFRAADSDEQVGLRLWFEYLQCASYESGFYERLVELKYNSHLQRGYEEKTRELLNRGWQWRMVEKVSGSGHTNLVRELCPPVVKEAASPAVRRDSVVGSGRERQLSTERGRKSKREDFECVIKGAKVPQEAGAQGPTPPSKPSAGPASNTLPPHLRGKSTASANANARSTLGPAAPTKPVPPSSLANVSDLEAARRLNSSFTKAKPVRRAPLETQHHGQRAAEETNRGWASVEGKEEDGGEGKRDVVW